MLREIIQRAIKKKKHIKCIVPKCENYQDEGAFNGRYCSLCFEYIAHGRGTYSQAYRNALEITPIIQRLLEQQKRTLK